MPEIIAGLRIATVSTVAIATLAVFAGAGGLGAEIYNDITFKTGIVVAGGLAVLLAIGLDVLLVGAQRLLSPWRRVRPVSVGWPIASVFDTFGGAIDFIFSQRDPVGVTGQPVGGLAEVLGFMWTQTWISVLALVVSGVDCAARSGSTSATAGPESWWPSRLATRGGDSGARPDRVHGGVRRGSVSST